MASDVANKQDFVLTSVVDVLNGQLPATALLEEVDLVWPTVRRTEPEHQPATGASSATQVGMVDTTTSANNPDTRDVLGWDGGFAAEQLTTALVRPCVSKQHACKDTGGLCMHVNLYTGANVREQR